MSRSGLLMCAGALVLGLAFLTIDSSLRLRTIAAVSTLRVSEAPVPQRDPASATGYEFSQHRLMLPAVATDGYHWILQTERLLAGDALRIRSTSVDNAPHGRDVHWSSPLRWWLAGVARIHSSLRPGITPAHALEQVAAWANTLLLAILLVVLTPVLARRLGAAAATLFALAWIAVFPLYESFLTGILDHHGLIAMSGFCAVAFLTCGLIGDGGDGGDGEIEAGTAGGGTTGAGAGAGAGDLVSARRWFIAAGVAGGIGLWLSAVSLIPILLAIAVAAVITTGLLGRGEAPPGERRSTGRQSTGRKSTGWRPAPGLWRIWGAAGCATSIAAWLIEYFPSHMGMRLEVNHPLHALVWLGGGDLIARISTGLHQERPWLRDQWRWLLADLLLIAATPVFMLAATDTTFLLADPLLREVHRSHITEFRGLASHLTSMSGLQILQNTTVLPLLLLPSAALLTHAHTRASDARVQGSASGAGTLAWHMLVGSMVLAGVAFVHVATVPVASALLAAAGLRPADPVAARLLGHAAALVPDAAAFGLLYLGPSRWKQPGLHPQHQALLVLAALPALTLLALTFWQVRWLGSAAASMLVLLVTIATVYRVAPEARPARRPQRLLVAAFLALVLAPFPLLTAAFPWQFGYSAASEVPQVVTRDIAHQLRHRLGSEVGVVASGPTTTTWLIYFGGMRGLGTLYWENAEGLRATADIFAARTADDARKLIDQRGVTHLVIPSWDLFTPGDPSRQQEQQPDSFIRSLIASDSTPAWLVELTLDMPRSDALRHTSVRIYEVARPGRVHETVRPPWNAPDQLPTGLSGAVQGEAQPPLSALRPEAPADGDSAAINCPARGCASMAGVVTLRGLSTIKRRRMAARAGDRQ
ncbi:hypothetical protein BH23GEM9_BH23GEM9_33990 [soil metagenome]